MKVELKETLWAITKGCALGVFYAAILTWIVLCGAAAIGILWGR